jgi:hypothetical protein
MIYDRPFDSFNSPSGDQTPKDFSSYTLEDRIARAMGKMAMYIITIRLNCTAGLTFARLNVEVPV